jgi:hypothetical protein
MSKDMTAFLGLGAGMTLRDYFAAKVIGGLMANTEVPFGDELDSAIKWASEQSYNIADAMLKAREINND